MEMHFCRNKSILKLNLQCIIALICTNMLLNGKLFKGS
jgi:hypothetical protein